MLVHRYLHIRRYVYKEVQKFQHHLGIEIYKDILKGPTLSLRIKLYLFIPTV